MGPKERVSKFLRISSRLRDTSAHLNDRHCYEEICTSLDRQLAQVERTREMIAKVCGDQLMSLRESQQLAADDQVMHRSRVRSSSRLPSVSSRPQHAGVATQRGSSEQARENTAAVRPAVP